MVPKPKPIFKNLKHVHTIVKEHNQSRIKDPRMQSGGEVPYGIFEGNVVFIGSPSSLHSDVLHQNKDKKPLHMGTFFMEDGNIVHMGTSISVQRNLKPVPASTMAKIEQELRTYLKDHGTQGLKFERFPHHN